MKKLLSYVLPIVVRKIPTKHNGVVELTYSKGKKLLDSKSANYSYGSLQAILKFALTKINLTGVNHILLLGLGGGSVIDTLINDFNFQGKIIAVDFDEIIIKIATEEFDIKNNSQLSIINDDAHRFIHNTSETFDLIIVDIYIDDIVPENFYSLDFWKDIYKVLNPNGHFIFNASINKDHKLPILMDSLTEHFELTKHERVENTNDVLMGRKLTQ